MRKQIWITGVAILALCLLFPLILHKKAEQPKTVAPEQIEPASSKGNQASSSNQPSQSQAARSTERQQASNVLRTLALPPSATPLASAIAQTNPVAAHALELWQTPIEFYGKVVDENSNAIAGAQVSFHWVEVPDETGNRSTNTETDAEGLFSLHDARGPSLSVSVSKNGYYPQRGGAKYGPSESPQFSADPQNPVIFFLRKKGTPAESLVTLNHSYRIPRDGTPVSIDLVSGANTTGENGNLVVRCWTKDQGKKSGEKYDWRSVVSVPGGGIVLTDEEFPFSAPESGYKPSIEINMPEDKAHWQSEGNLKFYYRLADGRFGRMTFSMIAGGQHFCLIDSVLNPSGSRNLEPK